MPMPCHPRTICFALFTVLLAGCGGSDPAPSPGAAGTPATRATEGRLAAEGTAPEVPPLPPVTPVADWLIVPGERVGLIVATSTAAELAAGYGADNVRDEPFHLGEGESEPGTVIFPNDPAKRAVIRWNDLDKKAQPLAVRIDGEGSQWKTAEGLAVGVTLKRVEALNGKPFQLYGFGWDYGGQLVDSNGGALKDLPHDDPEGGFRGGALLLTFQPDPAAAEKMADEYAQVAGDTAIASDHPAMQALDPKVTAITINFPDAG